MHDQLKTSLSKIDATNSVEELNRVSIEEENKLLAFNELDEIQKKAFNAFFSTLRHSANFWGRE